MARALVEKILSMYFELPFWSYKVWSLYANQSLCTARIVGMFIPKPSERVLDRLDRL